METVRYDCNCDTVIAMEEMAAGTEEILQYARAILSRDDVRTLIRGLEEILEGAAGTGSTFE
jgi:hypothetical protein